jgi:hypothetical protein
VNNLSLFAELETPTELLTQDICDRDDDEPVDGGKRRRKKI